MANSFLNEMLESVSPGMSKIFSVPSFSKPHIPREMEKLVTNSLRERSLGDIYDLPNGGGLDGILNQLGREGREITNTDYDLINQIIGGLRRVPFNKRDTLTPFDGEGESIATSLVNGRTSPESAAASLKENPSMGELQTVADIIRESAGATPMFRMKGNEGLDLSNASFSKTGRGYERQLTKAEMLAAQIAAMKESGTRERAVLKLIGELAPELKTTAFGDAKQKRLAGDTTASASKEFEAVLENLLARLLSRDQAQQDE